MNEHSAIITISIGDNTYEINPQDKSSIARIPWQERKKIIQLAEVIRQAEHVSSKPPSTVVMDKHEASIFPTVERMAVARKKPSQVEKILGKDSRAPAKDDTDLIMQQLILEQKGGSKIPDKKDVYKWLVGIFAVIIVLILLF